MFFKDTNIRERLIQEEDLEAQYMTDYLEGGEESKLKVVNDDRLIGAFDSQKPWKEEKDDWRRNQSFSRLKFFLPMCYMASFGTLHYFAYTTSRQGVKDKNSYTIKHYEFNSNICQFIYKTAFTVWVFLNTLRPQVRYKTCCCCMNFIVWFILGCFRNCVFAFAVYDIPRRLVLGVVYQAWALNWTNYWKSSDEPFLTNASKFNAGLCWYFTIPFMFWGPLLCLYMLIALIAIFYALIIKKKFTLMDIFQTFLWLLWDFDEKDHKVAIKKRVVLNDSKEAQANRDAFFKKQSWNCSRLFMSNNGRLDCVFCGQAFVDDDMVIEVSFYNLAHVQCMKDYLKYPTESKRDPRDTHNEIELEQKTIFGQRANGDNLYTPRYSASQFTSSYDPSSSEAQVVRPVDYGTLKYEKVDKELTEIYKFEDGLLVDEDLADSIAKDVFRLLKSYLDEIKDEKDDDLCTQRNRNFTHGECKTQLQNVIDSLKAAGFVDEAETKADPQEGEAMEAPPQEEMETQAMEMESMEGGEVDDLFNLKQYENDTEDYSGKGNIAKLLLHHTIVSPVFGDLLRQYLLNTEMDVILYNRYYNRYEHEVYARINGLICAYVQSFTADEPKDVWFTGIYMDDNLKPIKYLQSKNHTVAFPGLIQGWASEQEARDNHVNWSTDERKQKWLAKYGPEKDPYGDNHLENKNMVLFKVNAKSFSGLHNREIIFRLNAKLDEYKEVDGIHTFTLTQQDNTMSLANWKNKYPEEAKIKKEDD